MGEQLPPHIRIHGFIIGPAALHLVAEDAKGQRITLAAFLDCGHLCRCGGDAGERQQNFSRFLIQQQILGFKDLHPPLIAEGRQPAGDGTAAQEDKMRFGALHNQRVKGLLCVQVFEGLHIVQQNRVTGKVRCRFQRFGQRIPPADGVRFQQGRSCGALATAAGGGEQDHLPLAPCRLKFFLQFSC